MQDTTNLDLSQTVFEQGSEPTLIDANGTEYLVGRDAYGWLTIAHVEVDVNGVAYPLGDYPYTSFSDTNELLRAIEEA